MIDGAWGVEWAGEPMVLMPQRALWWPARRWLLVADVHLGKASVFRQAGYPVPEGTTLANLARLDVLIDRLAPHGLVVLGDLLHAKTGVTDRLRERVAGWRDRHADLDVWLVRGNHDAHAGDPPADWRVQVVQAPWRVGPFALCHEPASDPSAFVIAGHVHPVCALRGPGRDRLRLPCFAAGPGGAILPAFGEFTGGAAIDAVSGWRCYAVGAERVWPLAAPFA